ncbi:MAG: hypothetical protein K9M57_07130 [Phycisphaerae bacterium]|nr:hypothetical protein [Phycisphaerae bacterium]
MLNQGRLIKVMLLLMMAMTAGALILFALEGQPIKPTAFSLSSQNRMPEIRKILGIQHGVKLGPWRDVEITYDANEGQLTPTGRLNGSFSSQYHLVINSATINGQGPIFASQKWSLQSPCHIPDYSAATRQTIRICVIKTPDSQNGTSRQARLLDSLLTYLVKHFQVDVIPPR